MRPPRFLRSVFTRSAKGIDAPVDDAFYNKNYAYDLRGIAPSKHYRKYGRERGFLPSQDVDPDAQALLGGLGGGAEADLSPAEIYEKLCRHILVHFPEYDGFFWTFLDTQAPPVAGARRSYDEDQMRRRERLAEMSFTLGGRTCQIDQPSTDEFLSSLSSSTPVFHGRLPHGFWDALSRTFTIRRILADQFSQDPADEKTLRLAIRITRAIAPHTPVLFENVISETFDIANKLPTDLEIALAFKSFPDGGPGIFGSAAELPPRAPFVFEAAAECLGERRVFGDAMLLKRVVMAGEFNAFIDTIRGRPVLLIANEGLADFGRRFDIPNCLFIEIPPFDSQEFRQQILQRCREGLRHLSDQSSRQTPPIVLTRCGGSFSFWLFGQLHAEFPSASYVDIGQAINLWFLDKEGIVLPGGLPWTAGLEKQLALNKLQEFYREKLRIDDFKSFHIERHGVADPQTRWRSGSRFMDYARLLSRFGLMENVRVCVERALEERPDDPAALQMLSRLS
ncbi:hypothetical protein GGD81_003318 [Rhodobium orientis]|uniref:Uncharacterized protein n=2 Tax=Rhodobium orientis TaxID=34017 RepID=A0A327JQL9_9HYPH|nr:hypothetical protein [Rhodobium orientis]MBB4304260.1 hypothetical protein [Rhodobium orientis]MBK5948244.1 hypothetical protein [Rhodobium orientis]RAI28769.1 hypothetical protein CH339_05025 [Rhodobium orientis]